MQDDLLWVYEGQTQFWGWVLAARSGLQSRDMVLGQLASSAGAYAEQPGREWRSVEDTTHDPIIAARKAKPYPSLSRAEDYYSEGALIWLEVDQIIRAGTAGRKGIDDFARAFFGIRDGDWGVATYELADLVKALNAVHPHDWTAFFASRIASPGQPAPLGGIERGGYRLVWKEEPNPFDKARMEQGRNLSLYHSLGIGVDKDGAVTSSRWGGPAFNAGVVNGAKLIAVNGVAYDHDGLKRAIAQAKGTQQADRTADPPRRPLSDRASALWRRAALALAGAHRQRYHPRLARPAARAAPGPPGQVSPLPQGPWRARPRRCVSI